MKALWFIGKVFVVFLFLQFVAVCSWVVKVHASLWEYRFNENFAGFFTLYWIALWPCLVYLDGVYGPPMRPHEYWVFAIVMSNLVAGCISFGWVCIVALLSWMVESISDNIGDSFRNTFNQAIRIVEKKR